MGKCAKFAVPDTLTAVYSLKFEIGLKENSVFDILDSLQVIFITFFQTISKWYEENKCERLVYLFGKWRWYFVWFPCMHKIGLSSVDTMSCLEAVHWNNNTTMMTITVMMIKNSLVI